MLFTDVLYIWKAENSMIDVYIKAKRAIERRPFLARFLTSLEGLERVPAERSEALVPPM